MRKFIISILLIFTSTIAFSQSYVYEKSVEATGGVGLDKYQNYSFGITMVNGYRFFDYFYIGAGVGYEYLNGLYYTNYNYDSEDVRNNIKLYGRLQANLTKSKVSPFFAVDLGTNIGLSTNEIKMANGFYFEPMFGVDFVISEKQSIYLMLGYNGIDYDYKSFIGNISGEMQHVLAEKFTIHIGFKF